MLLRCSKKILDKPAYKGYNKTVFGVMAQLVERLVRNEEASGSNPLSSTKTKHAFVGVFLCFSANRQKLGVNGGCCEEVKGRLVL